MQPLFSVLVANYNNGRFIAECLESVLAQDYKHIEVVIVDDASTDNSLTIIQPYLAKNNFKLFVNKENKGVGYTKKRCIDESGGEICGFLDPDDTLTTNAVSKMITAHQENPQASLVYSNYFECNEQLKVVKTYHSQQVKNGLPQFFNENGYIGPFATFKKIDYLKTKGLNTYFKRAIDQDLYFKLYDVGESLHIQEVLYYYRIHQKGISSKEQADFAYYWYWVVCILRAQEKGINLERNFDKIFVRREKIQYWLILDEKLRQSFIYPILKWLKR